jgi:hypothetical protein
VLGKGGFGIRLKKVEEEGLVEKGLGKQAAVKSVEYKWCFDLQAVLGIKILIAYLKGVTKLGVSL